MRFKDIVQPATLDEAVEEMKNSKCTIIGGGLFLKLQKGTVNKGIDLSRLGLDYIRDERDLIPDQTICLLSAYLHSSLLPRIMLSSSMSNRPLWWGAEVDSPPCVPT